MKLNMDIIAKCLSSRYRVEHFGSSKRTLSLERPQLYEIGSSFQKNVLYILYTEMLPPSIPPVSSTLLCIGGMLPTAWMESNHQILFIQNSPGVIRIFNEVQEIYNTFEELDTAIKDELAKDTSFDIKHIIQQGVSMLNAPFLVMNSSLQLIFSAEIITDENQNTQILVNDMRNPLNLESYTTMKDACRLERIIKTPYISSETWAGQRLYCYNIYTMEHFTCCAWFVESASSFDSADFTLADYFFKYFEQAFHKYLHRLSNAESPETAVLHKILNNIPLSSKEHSLLQTNDGQRWVLFKLREKKNTPYMPHEYMCAMLNNLLPGTIYSITYNNEILGLLKLHCTETETDGHILESFSEMLVRMEYSAAISHKFTDLMKLNNYRQQVSYVTDKCIHDDGCQTLYYFKDYITQYILYECINRIPEETLISEGLYRLMLYDKEKGKDYIKSLNTYLKCEMNISKSAELLYIHRTSLMKRLDKIEKILGLNLQDSDTRLYLRICLNLLENNYITEK